MIRMAIVDDAVDMTDIIERYVLQTGRDNKVCFEIKKYTNPVALQFDIQERKTYDIYLIDIEMPTVNGIDLAITIRKKQENAYIVFVTSHFEFAIRGYDTRVRANNFILKSNLKKHITNAVEDAIRYVLATSGKCYIIKTQCRFEKLGVHEIIHVYKENKNAVFVTKKDKHRERKTLERTLVDLEDPCFLMIERGSIVNINHIDKIKNSEVTMDNGDELEISRANITRVKRNVNFYWRDFL